MNLLTDLLEESENLLLSGTIVILLFGSICFTHIEWLYDGFGFMDSWGFIFLFSVPFLSCGFLGTLAKNINLNFAEVLRFGTLFHRIEISLLHNSTSDALSLLFSQFVELDIINSEFISNYSCDVVVFFQSKPCLTLVNALLLLVNAVYGFCSGVVNARHLRSHRD